MIEAELDNMKKDSLKSLPNILTAAISGRYNRTAPSPWRKMDFVLDIKYDRKLPLYQRLSKALINAIIEGPPGSG